jgi:hypothetical protein
MIAHVSCHISQNLNLGNTVTLTSTRLGIWQSLLRAQNSDLDPKEEEDIKYVKTLLTHYQHFFFNIWIKILVGFLFFCMVGL